MEDEKNDSCETSKISILSGSGAGVPSAHQVVSFDDYESLCSSRHVGDSVVMVATEGREEASLSHMPATRSEGNHEEVEAAIVIQPDRDSARQRRDATGRRASACSDKTLEAIRRLRDGTKTGELTKIEDLALRRTRKSSMERKSSDQSPSKVHQRNGTERHHGDVPASPQRKPKSKALQSHPIVRTRAPGDRPHRRPPPASPSSGKHSSMLDYVASSLPSTPCTSKKQCDDSTVATISTRSCTSTTYSLSPVMIHSPLQRTSSTSSTSSWKKLSSTSSRTRNNNRRASAGSMPVSLPSPDGQSVKSVVDNGEDAAHVKKPRSHSTSFLFTGDDDAAVCDDPVEFLTSFGRAKERHEEHFEQTFPTDYITSSPREPRRDAKPPKWNTVETTTPTVGQMVKPPQLALRMTQGNSLNNMIANDKSQTQIQNPNESFSDFSADFSAPIFEAASLLGGGTGHNEKDDDIMGDNEWAAGDTRDDFCGMLLPPSPSLPDSPMLLSPRSHEISPRRSPNKRGEKTRLSRLEELPNKSPTYTSPKSITHRSRRSSASATLSSYSPQRQSGSLAIESLSSPTGGAIVHDTFDARSDDGEGRRDRCRSPAKSSSASHRSTPISPRKQASSKSLDLLCSAESPENAFCESFDSGDITRRPPPRALSSPSRNVDASYGKGSRRGFSPRSPRRTYASNKVFQSGETAKPLLESLHSRGVISTADTEYHVSTYREDVVFNDPFASSILVESNISAKKNDAIDRIMWNEGVVKSDSSGKPLTREHSRASGSLRIAIAAKYVQAKMIQSDRHGESKRK